MVRILPLTTPLPQVLEPYKMYLTKSVKIQNDLGETFPVYSFCFEECTLDLQQLSNPSSWTIVVKSFSPTKAKEILKDYPHGIVFTQHNTADGTRTYKSGASDEYISELFARITTNSK